MAKAKARAKPKKKAKKRKKKPVVTGSPADGIMWSGGVKKPMRRIKRAKP